MTAPVAVAAGTVRSALVVDQVYDILATSIVSGELPAGSRLRVRDMAAQVGTSVMPVREAIRLLVENGLAVTHPHRGARVREFTLRELVEIYDVRSVLEVEATKQGALRIGPHDVQAMRQACHRMRQAVDQGDVRAALDEDESILIRLYTASGNSVLTGVIESLWTQCRPYKFMGATAAIAADDPSLWEPQPALVSALEAGDSAGAVEITRRSVSAARARLETQLI